MRLSCATIVSVIRRTHRVRRLAFPRPYIFICSGTKRDVSSDSCKTAVTSIPLCALTTPYCWPRPADTDEADYLLKFLSLDLSLFIRLLISPHLSVYVARSFPLFVWFLYHRLALRVADRRFIAMTFQLHIPLSIIYCFGFHFAHVLF